MLRGSCLCRGVRFEVTPPFIRANHCHCSRCRKHSGTAVCTQARVRREQFTLLAGEELIRVYGRGEGAGEGILHGLRIEPVRGRLARGPAGVDSARRAFDDDPGIGPQFHTFVDSRAPWDVITDDLPQYPGASAPRTPRDRRTTSPSVVPASVSSQRTIAV